MFHKKAATEPKEGRLFDIKVVSKHGIVDVRCTSHLCPFHAASSRLEILKIIMLAHLRRHSEIEKDIVGEVEAMVI